MRTWVQNLVKQAQASPQCIAHAFQEVYSRLLGEFDLVNANIEFGHPFQAPALHCDEFLSVDACCIPRLRWSSKSCGRCQMLCGIPESGVQWHRQGSLDASASWPLPLCPTTRLPHAAMHTDTERRTPSPEGKGKRAPSSTVLYFAIPRSERQV